MKKFIIGIIILLAAVLAWYLISPAFTDEQVNEALPVVLQEGSELQVVINEEQQEVIESESQEMPDDIIVGADVVMEEPMMEMTSQESEQLIETRGSFMDADDFHQGEGDLIVIKDGDSQFLRFENFSVTNGPDLFVTLNKGDGTNGEHVIVAALKGNQGSQNYDVSEYDLSEYQSVSIYCRAFSTEFATAQL